MGAMGIAVQVACIDRLRAGDAWTSHQGPGAAPGHFFVGSRRVEAIAVLDRWLGADHSYFKVQGDDEATYILRHDLATDDWELTLYDSANLR